MPQPPVFLDPLTLSGVAVLSAQALYYAGHWLLGGREGKARAAEGFEKVVIAGVLFGLAMAVPHLLLLGVDAYLSLTGIGGSQAGALLSAVGDAQQFGDAMQAALDNASALYARYFHDAESSLTAFFWAVFGTGLTPWTQSWSMAIANVMSVAATVLGNVLVTAPIYAAAAALAKTWTAFLPVGAVLVTYERTRNLGAWLMAIGAVVPVVLALGAEVAYRTAPPVQMTWQNLIGDVGPVWDAVKAMVVLGLIGLTAAALAYAFSRIFDEVGAHFAVE